MLYPQLLDFKARQVPVQNPASHEHGRDDVDDETDRQVTSESTDVAAADEIKRLVQININAGRHLRGEVLGGPTQTGPGQYQTPMPYQAPPQSQPAQTLPVPGGGTATFTGIKTQDDNQYPIYKFPDGTFKPYMGGR